MIRTILTAAIAVGISLLLWVVLVTMLQNRIDGRDEIVWAGTLWLSALLSSGIVAYFRYATRPVLACTAAFAVFALVYMAAEGPIFGVEDEGGDLAKTQLVFWNLTFLPVGVFVAAELGARLASVHRAASNPAESDT